MTRKDYEALAAALRLTRSSYSGLFEPDYPGEVLDDVGDRIADVLQADNPRFDRERFLKAARGE